MRSPYCIGVWKPTISKALMFINEHYLGDNVIQIMPDPSSPSGSVWIMLRVTGDQMNAIKNTPGATVIA